jgi:hypothetical protein
MSWVPIAEEISKTKFGALVLKLKSDVLVKNFVLANQNFNQLVPAFFQLSKDERAPYFQDQLININGLDQLCLKLLLKNLPYCVETPYIIHYLIRRLQPGTLSTIEKQALQQYNIVNNVDYLKQLQTITKLEAIDEELLENTIIWKANKKFRKQIEQQMDEQMSKFMAEQRGNWLKKYCELKEQYNMLKKENQMHLKTIQTQLPSQIFCKALLTRFDQIREPLNQIIAYIFSGHKGVLKMYANMLKRRLNKIENMITLKSRNIKIEEEKIDEATIKQMKEDGSYWFPKIYEIIKNNQEYFKVYNKLEPTVRLKVMSLIATKTPHFHNFLDYDKHFTKKVETVYKENINLLASQTTEEEWEEIEDVEEEINTDLISKEVLEKIEDNT